MGDFLKVLMFSIVSSGLLYFLILVNDLMMIDSCHRFGAIKLRGVLITCSVGDK